MKPVPTLLLAVLLTTGACSANSPHAETVSSPPAADLVCPAEPDIAAALLTDPSGLSWDIAVREAGESCRQALARVCRWHQQRGAEVSCPPAVKP